jgi:signal transduction histidine kinase
VVAVDAEGFATTTSDLLALLLVGLIAVVVAIALLSWILTGRALTSVTRLTEKAEAAGPGDLVGGLPVPRGDAEVARLVGALNRMLQRLEAGHAKELQFAADAGHRLRTPVATLRAEAELALGEDDPVEQRAALGRILADADQLSLVVDRMLARIRSRKDTWEAVVPALTAASSGWQRQASLVDVEIDFRLTSDVSDSARSPEIVAVVEPLVDNAIRHTPPRGTVTVALSHGAAPDATTVTVDVSDTGPGIAPELVAQIFDAWVSTRDASSAGGLGLWLARETARDLGGDLQLMESRPGGTTFRVSLPLAEDGAH